MSDLVINKEKLVDFLGYFPTFHDDEILSVQFDRKGPTIFMEISTRQWTNEVDERGSLKYGKKGLITFRFDGVEQVKLEGECLIQNVILDMWFTEHEQDVLTQIQSSFGLGGTIVSKSVMIESVVPARDE